MWGDHNELEIFLEIRFIPSRMDQKLKNKERVHGFLKREIGPNSWVIEAVVGAVFRGRGGDSLGLRSRRDRVTIGLRSQFFVMLQLPSDEDLIVIHFCEETPPSDERLPMSRCITAVCASW